MLRTSTTSACLVAIAYNGRAGGCSRDLIYGMGGDDHASGSAGGGNDLICQRGDNNLVCWERWQPDLNGKHEEDDAVFQFFLSIRNGRKHFLFITISVRFILKSL